MRILQPKMCESRATVGQLRHDRGACHHVLQVVRRHQVRRRATRAVHAAPIELGADRADQVRRAVRLRRLAMRRYLVMRRPIDEAPERLGVLADKTCV